MRRVFLDANVLFSAAYGSPGIRILWQWAKDRRHELLASTHVVEEARRNLVEARHVARLDELLQHVARAATPPPDLRCPIELPDGDREAFLAALAAGATHFLTGDVRHFDPYYGKRYGGMLVQAPATYVEAFKTERLA